MDKYVILMIVVVAFLCLFAIAKVIVAIDEVKKELKK